MHDINVPPTIIIINCEEYPKDWHSNYVENIILSSLVLSLLYFSFVLFFGYGLALFFGVGLGVYTMLIHDGTYMVPI